MNANELAEIIQHLENANYMGASKAATMLRQQQAEMEELEKENTDLRYLIATKLEQQDGISLNSMAHPITNTPEPSYEIDPDKLETIEIDLPSPEPVAWINKTDIEDGFFYPTILTKMETISNNIPLYTYPAKEQDTDCQYCKQGCIRCDARKQLTDEEIQELSEKHLDMDWQTGVIDFARAILRKAQDNVG